MKGCSFGVATTNFRPTPYMYKVRHGLKHLRDRPDPFFNSNTMNMLMN